MPLHLRILQNHPIQTNSITRLLAALYFTLLLVFKEREKKTKELHWIPSRREEFFDIYIKIV
jgi:hypothetical protein